MGKLILIFLLGVFVGVVFAISGLHFLTFGVSLVLSLTQTIIGIIQSYLKLEKRLKNAVDVSGTIF